MLSPHVADDSDLTRILSSYLPGDRLRAFFDGHGELPEKEEGVILLADLRGFTPLTEMLDSALGPQFGAERLTDILNTLFEKLVEQVRRRSGHVINFGGDAFTAWFDCSRGGKTPAAIRHGVKCALELQEIMESEFSSIDTEMGLLSMSMRVGLAAGVARRFWIGVDGGGYFDTFAGGLVERMVSAETAAHAGEVLISREMLVEGAGIVVGEQRGDCFQVLEVEGELLPGTCKEDEELDPYDLPPQLGRKLKSLVSQRLYDRLVSGRQRFIAELQRATSSFIGFSGIDYDGDPDAREKLQSYYEVVYNIVNRYEGHICRLSVGDKGSNMYVVFGAPVRHEDDEARAVSCALDIREEVRRELPFIAEQRIGISSGRVFAGSVGHPMRQEYTIMGDAVNLSARLMQYARPWQILTCPATYRRAEENFVWKELGEIVVKGKVEATNVLSPAGKQRPREELMIHYIVDERRMINRRRELAVLEERAEAAASGSTQIIAIGGWAGVGKTRIAESIVRGWLLKGRFGYGGTCVSYGQGMPYYPWRELLGAFFSLREDEPDANKTTKVQMRVQTLVTERVSDTGLVLGLLSLPGGEGFDAHDRDTRRRLYETLAALFVAEASRRPTLLLLENLQWADVDSLSLLDYLTTTLRGDDPLLFCLVHRPRLLVFEAQPQPNFTRVFLNDLSEDDTRAMVQSLVTTLSMPIPLLNSIYNRTQGNPFYIQEVIEEMRNRGLIVRDGVTGIDSIVDDITEVPMPETVESVLMARLDRLLPEDRELLRIASVLGRRFDHHALWAMYSERYSFVSEESFRLLLENLVRNGLLSLESTGDRQVFTFKYVMMREVAYISLPFDLRRRLHCDIARYYEMRYADSLQARAATLAYHYDLGGVSYKAAYYALEAGSASLSYHNVHEAIDHLRRAVKHLEELREGAREEAREEAGPGNSLGEDADNMALLVSASDGLGDAYSYTGKIKDAIASYRQAVNASLEPERSLGVRIKLIEQCWYYDDIETCWDECYTAQVEMEDEDGWEAGAIYHWLATLEAFCGHWDKAEENWCRAMDIFNATGCVRGQAQVYTMSSLGIYSGHAAVKQAQKGVDLWRSLDDKREECRSWVNLALCHLYIADFSRATDVLEHALEMARALHDNSSIALARGYLALTLVNQGRFDEALAHALSPAQMLWTGEAELHRGWLLYPLIYYHFWQDNQVSAEGLLPQAEAVCPKDAWYSASILRLGATIAFDKGEIDATEHYVRRGLQAAQRTGYGHNLIEKGILSRLAARVAMHKGDMETVPDSLGDSIDALMTADNLLELSETLQLQADWSMYIGDVERARSIREHARYLVRALG